MGAHPRRSRNLAALPCALLLGALARDVSAEVVVVVSRDNPTTTLKANEVTDLFLGRSSRFPDGRPAIPVEQAEGSPLQEQFYAAHLSKTRAQMKAHWSKLVFTGRGEPPKELPNDDAVLKMIAADPRIVGYVDAASVDERVQVVRSP